MSTKGRLELLQWLNELTECDYGKVEMLADGVGLCQVLDALHPNFINLSRLNFNARFPEDFTKNLKLLDESLVKLKVKEAFAFDKMAKGKFQDNMQFLQWLYNYARRMGPQHFGGYPGYQKRLQALDRQRKDVKQMSTHLIPNQAFFPGKEEDWQPQPSQYFDVEYEDVVSNKRSNQNAQFIKDLQSDLKNRMEKNWKLMHNLDKVIEQRNALHTKLQQVQRILCKQPNSHFKQKLIDILLEVPDDFRPA